MDLLKYCKLKPLGVALEQLCHLGGSLVTGKFYWNCDIHFTTKSDKVVLNIFRTPGDLPVETEPSSTTTKSSIY